MCTTNSFCRNNITNVAVLSVQATFIDIYASYESETSNIYRLNLKEVGLCKGTSVVIISNIVDRLG